jgi:hypothetical protein
MFTPLIKSKRKPDKRMVIVSMVFIGLALLITITGLVLASIYPARAEASANISISPGETSINWSTMV